MRKTETGEKDYEIKNHGFYLFSENDRNRLFGVFEDRKSVVDMWRKIMYFVSR